MLHDQSVVISQLRPRHDRAAAPIHIFGQTRHKRPRRHINRPGRHKVRRHREPFVRDVIGLLKGKDLLKHFCAGARWRGFVKHINPPADHRTLGLHRARPRKPPRAGHAIGIQKNQPRRGGRLNPLVAGGACALFGLGDKPHAGKLGRHRPHIQRRGIVGHDHLNPTAHLRQQRAQTPHQPVDVVVVRDDDRMGQRGHSPGHFSITRV